MRKMNRIFTCLITLLLLSMTVGCKLFFNFFGTRSEAFLYSNRKTIEKQNQEWTGSSFGSSDSRSVTGDMVKDVRSMFTENMDYMALNDYITSAELFPNGLFGEYKDKYGPMLPDGFDYAVLVLKTNNGALYILDAPYEEGYNGYFDQWYNGDVSYLPHYGIRNKDFKYADGVDGYVGIAFTNRAAGDGINFSIEMEPIITNEFPYPMYYRFDTKAANMHSDGSGNYFYWGVDLTGDEAEKQPSFEEFTIEQFLENVDNGAWDYTEITPKVRAAIEGGYFLF